MKPSRNPNINPTLPTCIYVQWLPLCAAVRVAGYIWTAIVRMLLCVSVGDWVDMMWDSAADCGLLQERLCHVQPLKIKAVGDQFVKNKPVLFVCVCVLASPS